MHNQPEHFTSVTGLTGVADQLSERPWPYLPLSTPFDCKIFVHKSPNRTVHWRYDIVTIYWKNYSTDERAQKPEDIVKAIHEAWDAAKELEDVRIRKYWLPNMAERWEDTVLVLSIYTNIISLFLFGS